MQNGKNDRLTHWMMTFVALFLLIGLTGCGPASISNTPFENDDPVSEAEEVVITFSYDEYAYSMFRPLIEAFHEENPTITVQYVPLSTEDYNSPKSVDDRLLMLAKSADTTLTVIRTASLGNYFLDLQPLMDADSAFDSSDFWPGSLSALEDAQGRVLGLPMSIFVQGIFYDKAAFDAANLACDDPQFVNPAAATGDAFHHKYIRHFKGRWVAFLVVKEHVCGHIDLLIPTKVMTQGLKQVQNCIDVVFGFAHRLSI